MSRFARVEIPPMSPAQCKICGTATRGPFVDLKYAEDYYGSVYYCFDCAGEIASIVGYVLPSKHDEVVTRNMQLEHDLAEAELALTKAKNLSGFLDDIIKHYDNAVLSLDGSIANPVPQVPLITNEIVDSGTNVVNESSDESGLADVFAGGNINEAPKRAGTRAKLVDI